MKKISAVFLAFLMILTSAVFPVFADETTIVINAPADVTKTNGKVTEGIDHHDVAGQVYGANFYTVRNLGGKDHLALHDGDWVRYDMSDFVPGKYKVSMTYLPAYLKENGKTYPSTIAFELDGKDVFSKSLPFNTSEQTSDIGEISIDENSSYLFVKLACETKVPAQYISVFTFEKLKEPAFVSYAAEGKDGDTVSRGADKFTILMEDALDGNTVNENTVMIKDEAGNSLDAFVSSGENKITIELKETLDYEKEYTIYIDGIKSATQVSLSKPIEKVFTASTKENDSGKSDIEVTSYIKEGNTITAEGALYSSVGVGIKGREVVLSDIDALSGDVLNETSVISDKDGLFKISYVIGEDSAPGKHEIEITSDYVKNPYVNYFVYLTDEVAKEMAEDLSGLVNLTEAKTQIDKYIDYMDVDTEEADRMIADFDKVYEKMMGKDFTSADDVLNCFKEIIYFEMLVQSEVSDDIVSVLDDEQKASFITEFDYSLWNVLSVENKSALAEKVINENFDNVSDLGMWLTENVKTELKKQFGIKKADISFGSCDVLSGQDAQITVSASESLKDVYGIYLELSYDEENGIFFENPDSAVTANGAFESEIKAENNVLSIALVAKNEPQTVSGELLTIKVPTNGKTVGEFSAKTSGYVLYHPAEITDESTQLKEEINVLSDVSVVVNEISELEKGILDVLEGGDGVGYFDAGGKGVLEGGGPNAPTAVIMRTGDWQAYDISALSAGNYEVFFEGGIAYNGVAFTVNIDDKAQIVNKAVEPTGGYFTYKEALLGKVTLDGNQKTLKLLQSGSQATYATKIRLSKIYPLKALELTSNTGVENGKTSQGSDSFKVLFNNELSENGFDVNITSAEGKNILCTGESEGKNAVINLAEALDYNETYTITINNIFDSYGQELLNYSVSFETLGEDVLKGDGSLKINEVTTEGNKAIIKGEVLSSENVGIKGRKVKISAKSQNDSEFVLWQEGVSGLNGAFELTYEFGENESGKFEVLAEAEYAKASAKENVYYYSKEDSRAIANAFSGVLSGEAVLEKLRANEELLGINLSDYEPYLTEIADGMINKNYEIGALVLEEINARFVMEKLNDAEDADEILEMIDGGELKDIGNIQENKWNLYSEEEKLIISENIKNMDDFENPEDVLIAVNNEINKILSDKNNIENAKVNIKASNVVVGQSAELKFSFEEKQENVAKVTIWVSYDEKAGLFENGGDLSVSNKLKGFAKNIKKENGKITFEISSSEPASISGDVMTASFVAEKGTEGIYKPQIKGYVTYYLINDENGLTVDVPFESENSVQITVSAQNSSEDKPSGGGNGYREPSGGGSSHGGGASGNVNSYSDVKTTTDIKVIFTDIEHVSWAKDSINALAKKGVLSGRGDGTFAPDDSVTRAEFCKIITLAFGMYDKKYECSFKDVAKDTWYYSYIASAKAYGLVNGRDDGTFGANDTITREEMAAIALRAVKMSNVNETEKFADDSEISAYAKDAVYTLKALGVMDGVGNNMFAPKASVTRAQAAKVINMLETAI